MIGAQSQNFRNKKEEFVELFGGPPGPMKRFHQEQKLLFYSLPQIPSK